VAQQKVELLGQRELEKRLDAFSQTVEYSGKAGKTAATLVARTAAGLGPNRSGDLGKSYRGLGSKKQGRVVSKLIYSPVIEFGWPARGIVPQLRVQRAIEANAGNIQAIYERYVRDQLAAADKR